MSISGEKSAAEFYDTLASDYDRMTGFEGRFIREGPSFKAIAEDHGIAAALDAGCGTGFHSLLLARLGVNVTAVDLSEVMLERLRRHAQRENLSIATVRASFQELQQHLTTPFDGVFCMGNALAHLLTADDLRLALRNFFGLLKPGGHSCSPGIELRAHTGAEATRSQREVRWSDCVHPVLRLRGSVHPVQCCEVDGGEYRAG